jgi:hypothetical protein
MSYQGKNPNVDTLRLNPGEDPATPATGEMQYSDGTDRAAGFYVYNGSSWDAVATSSGVPVSVVTKTANYTITTADDVILVDGTSGAFTITMPPANSSPSKIYTIKRIDNTLANVVTIDGSGAELIEGSSSVSSCTIGEVYKLASTGTAWTILDHQTKTDWVSAGNFIDYYTFTCTSANCTIGATYTNNGNTYTVARTSAAQTTIYLRGPADPTASGTLTKTSGTGDATITFSAFTGKAYRVSATTTAPTFNANTTTNSMKWRREGKYAIVRVNFYIAATNAGVSGSGDYIFPMPLNMSIDSTVSAFFTGGTAGAIIAQDEANIQNLFPARFGRATTAAAEQYSVTSCAPYDATHYRVYGTNTNTDGAYSLGSTIVEAANGAISYVWELEFPIANWKE